MSKDTFITNQATQNLGERIRNLISHSLELKFLVGFFYFSGMKELYESLKQNDKVTLKVLVGLNAEKRIHGIIEYANLEKNLSNEAITNLYFQSLKESINTEIFDTKEFYEQVKFFIELVEKNRLLIRKTYYPNHAKLYLFKLENQLIRPSLFITGSSNLTSSGLTYQQEFNVEISDYGVDKAEKYFEDLWKEAVQLTENEKSKQRLLNLLQQESLIKEITPFEAYVYILKTYLDSFAGKELSQELLDVLKEGNYHPYNYQIDAVKQALNIIDKNNGVIIADVVGLGKTVIACSIAYELQKRGVVIAPPGLLGNEAGTEGWNKYLEDFHLTELGWKSFSSGNLEVALEYVLKAKNIQVVIVDEAHRFRNQDTKSYELLKNICRGKIVILLTATPFNNHPSDIFSLLKLFLVPKKSSITLTNNLELKFSEFKNSFEKLAYIKRYATSTDKNKKDKAISYYENFFGNKEINLNNVKERAYYLANEIKYTIEPVTIRRNRLDLKENPHYQNEINALSQMENPIEWFYELEAKQSEFYDQVIHQYFATPENNGVFKGAIYRPFAYKIGLNNLGNLKLESKETFQYFQQFNLYDFMRRLLVKRFESSFGAFQQSLINFKNITEIVLGFIKERNKYILDRQLLEKIYNKDESEIEEELKEYSERIKSKEYPKNHEVYEIENFKDKEQFLKDIESDKKLFEHLLDKIQQLSLVTQDPKAKTLIQNLKENLKNEPERKIIIFSEYKDTVQYLKPILNENFKNRVLTIEGNLNQSKTTEIYENFDASYPEGKQKNNYDILLATDKISEGFNLNRAGMVINYDIPWNPVRVIQRVGRINRISKKVFDKLYIVNFFPTEVGASLVRSREIAANKMFLIHNALGEDSKIFDIEEEPSPAGLYERIQKNPDELEEASFYTKVLKEFEEIKKQDPTLIQNLQDFPPRIKVAKSYNQKELIVIIKKVRLFVYRKDYSSETIEQLNLETILENLKADKKAKALPLSNRFWEEYEKIKNFSEKEKTIVSDVSLTQKSINNLKSLLASSNMELKPYHPFIEMLLEDILDYGTLSDYTLRRIANIDIDKNGVTEIKTLQNELGENYLFKEKERTKNLTKEIIIAIENQNC